MKVWRVISLSLCGIFLCGCALISLTYTVLDHSVLDQTKVKQALTAHGFYNALRSEQIIPELYKTSSLQLATNNNLLKRQDILDALQQVFTQTKVTQISDVALNNIYAWLNKKQLELTFSVSVSDEKKQLLSLLSNKIDQRAQSLPDCTIAETIAFDTTNPSCIPFFLTASTISAQAKQVLADKFEPISGSITNDDLGLTPSKLGQLAYAPDYIGYLWALNLITLPLAVLTSLYLLFKRRGQGVIVIGAALLLNGAAAVAGYVVMSKPFPYWHGAAFDAALQALKAVVQSTFTMWIGLGLGGGIVLLVLGAIWNRQSKRRSSPSHYVSTDRED